MRIRKTGSIPYVMVRPPAAISCDARAKNEMMRRVNFAAHAAMLGMGSGAILLITPDAAADFEDERREPVSFAETFALNR